MECPICYDQNALENLICGHAMCSACLDRWFRYSEQCPMCRAVVHRHHEFEIVIVDEDDPELMSVFYPTIQCVSPTMRSLEHPDHVFETIRTFWNHKASTTQFASSSLTNQRQIYFMIYMNGQVSRKWYLTDFSNVVKERLDGRANVARMLHEFELVLAETVYLPNRN